jgi:Tol biopolymer transport system component
MDLGALALTGEAAVVGTDVGSIVSNGRAGFSVSDNGVLVYSSTPDNRRAEDSLRLRWVDRAGKPLRAVGPPVSGRTFRLSPEGTRAAVLEISGDRAVGRSLWIADLTRGTKAPLTSGSTLSPTWSADGARLLFAEGAGSGRTTIAERAANGATPARQFHEEADKSVVPLDESADGKWLVFSMGGAGARSLHVMPRSGGTPTVYLADTFDYPQASISPDGRWLAYTSNESGTYEVIVQSFPDPSRGKWPISTRGGTSPRWRRDGKELFYVDFEQQLIAVSVSSDRDFVPGQSTPLFTVPVETMNAAYNYDVAPDGQTFLMVDLPGGGATDSRVPLTVTTNWTSLLKKK